MKVATDRPSPPVPADHPPARRRFLNGRTALDVLAALIFLAVGVSTFAFIHRFAVNMVYYDQWTDIDLIRHAHAGTLSFGLLWAQHNEHRILFPNLVVLLLAYTTHFNLVVEDYLNGFLSCAAVALLILAHKRRSPTIAWIWYCPVALVALSFISLTGTLLGFNLIWFLALFALAACLYFLDRTELTWLGLAGASSFAVLGSFSSLQGLYIWPAGLVLMALRRRSRSMMLAWVAAAVATAIVYFANFDFSQASGGSSVFHHPGTALRYFFTLIGNVFGTLFPTPNAGDTTLLVVGVVVSLIAIWATIRVIARGPSGGGPIGVALICYGFVFVASATYGRSQLGIANSSRYVIFIITIWIGAYLASTRASGTLDS